ncbi:MAG: phospholipase [Planctomycetota bacterium]|jgi:predicted peptidase|nr:MAG: phospholipase [Planctomycetota bacterium]
MNWNLRFGLPLLGLLVTAQCAWGDESPQKAARLDVALKVQMDYLIALPQDYDKQEKVPLVVFLHGAGERGRDLQKVKVHGPPKLIEAGKKFPFILVSPQCPEGQWWQAHELIALLDEIESKYKVDKDRIYVTGLSMGGFGSWRLAAEIPQRIAAIAPICGGGDTSTARRLAKMPIWVFHGAKDTAVPLDLSQSMVDAITKAGGTPKLTIYPEAGHDSWTESYNNPEFYEWLLKQKRS